MFLQRWGFGKVRTDERKWDSTRRGASCAESAGHEVSLCREFSETVTWGHSGEMKVALWSRAHEGVGSESGRSWLGVARVGRRRMRLGLALHICSERTRYLLAFGPSRHRAWVVGQRPLKCSLGSRGRPLGGLLEQVLKPLGGSLGASWGFFWGSWGPLGASWGCLAGIWGPLGASWGPSGGLGGWLLG